MDMNSTGFDFAGFGAGLGGVAGLINAGTNIGVAIKNGQIADRNYELQQGQFEYEKALQQKIFDREDTAYQRALSDITKAGFSPIAALGKSSGAGNIVSIAAPQHAGYQSPDLSPIISAAQLINTAETDRINRNATQLNNDINNYNFEWYKDHGLPTDAGMTDRLVSTLLQILGTNYNDLPSYIRGKMDDFVSNLSDTANSMLDGISPAVADVESLSSHEKNLETTAVLNAAAAGSKGETPSAPKIDLSQRRYKDALATWKKAESDILYMYGDPAYSEFVEDWYRKNPKPQRKDYKK